MKSKGFTLIEVIAVIIIIGVIALIANPLVQNFIISSKKSSFSSSAYSFLETAKAKIEMREFGDFEDDEAVIVPLKYLKVERGSTKDSAFGTYDLERSYIIVYPQSTEKGPAFKYFINLTDNTGHAIREGTFNTLRKDLVIAGESSRIPTLNQIMTDGYGSYRFLENRNIYESTMIAGAEIFILLKK